MHTTSYLHIRILCNWKPHIMIAVSKNKTLITITYFNALEHAAFALIVAAVARPLSSGEMRVSEYTSSCLQIRL